MIAATDNWWRRCFPRPFVRIVPLEQSLFSFDMLSTVLNSIDHSRCRLLINGFDVTQHAGGNERVCQIRREGSDKCLIVRFARYSWYPRDLEL